MTSTQAEIALVGVRPIAMDLKGTLQLLMNLSYAKQSERLRIELGYLGQDELNTKRLGKGGRLTTSKPRELQRH